MSAVSLPEPSVLSGLLLPLSPADSPAVFDLYARCADFFIFQDGEAPNPADAEELFADVPPSKRPEDQYVFGYYRDGRLDALATVLRDHPQRGDWYLGLLLVDPSWRRQAIGREIYKIIEGWAANKGAERILIAVLQENVAAHRFWCSLGFDLVRTVESRTFNQKSHSLYELARQL